MGGSRPKAEQNTDRYSTEQEEEQENTHKANDQLSREATKTPEERTPSSAATVVRLRPPKKAPGCAVNQSQLKQGGTIQARTRWKGTNKIDIS